MRVFKSAWFMRFSRREKIADQSLRDAVERAEKGLVDADLGGGLIKQRIPRQGAGKSGGYRSLLMYRKGDKAFFVFGFPKNELDNIRQDEEEQFRRAARLTLALSDEQIALLIENGRLEEITKDAKKISQ